MFPHQDVQLHALPLVADFPLSDNPVEEAYPVRYRVHRLSPFGAGKPAHSAMRYPATFPPFPLSGDLHFKIPPGSPFRLDQRLAAHIELTEQRHEDDCLLDFLVEVGHVLAGVMAELAIGAGAINGLPVLYRQKVVLIAGFALNRPGHLGLSLSNGWGTALYASLVRLRVSPRL